MGGGRGKGKKQSVIAKQEEPGSEEEKVSAYIRRARLQKPLKDEIEKVEASGNIEDGENMKMNISSTDMKNQVITENKRKRKGSELIIKIDAVKEENDIRRKQNPVDSTKSAGFRQNGSRRKNKPRRAAEAGIDFK